MTLQEALAAAEEFLKTIYPVAPPTIVLRAEWVEEHAWAWRVLFDTQEHLDTGDFMQAPMVRLVVVPKDGSRVDFMPSSFGYEKQQAYLATGQRTFER
jgi:hypothetical protein